MNQDPCNADLDHPCDARTCPCGSPDGCAECDGEGLPCLSCARSAREIATEVRREMASAYTPEMLDEVASWGGKFRSE